MPKLSGKVAIVTGAAGGIGSATARLFAEEGAAVALVDLRSDALAALADEIVEKGGEVLAVRADVTDEQGVRAAVDRVTGEWGRLDVLVNNAGLAMGGLLVDTALEDWNRVLAVNLTSAFLMTKHAAPRMADGAIVNISSVAALMAVTEASAYTAAKGGVLALTRVAAAELGPAIRVNCICPGTVLTGMPEEMFRRRGDGDVEAGIAITARKYLTGRLGTAEEIASTALFLAGPDGSFFTGAVLAADGGVSAQ
ncbi:MAG: SDR family NAD(P)-dependent oxidoreductase [Pseudonocardia sp.]